LKNYKLIVYWHIKQHISPKERIMNYLPSGSAFYDPRELQRMMSGVHRIINAPTDKYMAYASGANLSDLSGKGAGVFWSQVQQAKTQVMDGRDRLQAVRDQLSRGISNAQQKLAALTDTAGSLGDSASSNAVSDAQSVFDSGSSFVNGVISAVDQFNQQVDSFLAGEKEMSPGSPAQQALDKAKNLLLAFGAKEQQATAKIADINRAINSANTIVSRVAARAAQLTQLQAAQTAAQKQQQDAQTAAQSATQTAQTAAATDAQAIQEIRAAVDDALASARSVARRGQLDAASQFVSTASSALRGLPATTPRSVSLQMKNDIQNAQSLVDNIMDQQTRQAEQAAAQARAQEAAQAAATAQAQIQAQVQQAQIAQQAQMQQAALAAQQQQQQAQMQMAMMQMQMQAAMRQAPVAPSFSAAPVAPTTAYGPAPTAPDSTAWPAESAELGPPATTYVGYRSPEQEVETPIGVGPAFSEATAGAGAPGEFASEFDSGDTMMDLGYMTRRGLGEMAPRSSASRRSGGFTASNNLSGVAALVIAGLVTWKYILPALGFRRK
jgi:hypothetical protein